MSHAQSLQSLTGNRLDLDPYHHQSQEDRPQRQRLDHDRYPPHLPSAFPAQRKAIPGSLAQIQVPSFSAFRSQLPITPSSATPKPGQQHGLQPARASFSRSEKASPRLADPAARPLSVDSPQLLQSNQFGGRAIPPTWRSAVESPPEDR